MPLTLAPTAKSLVGDITHRFATLWRVQRSDGTTLRFTDHDLSLAIVEADNASYTYAPAGGITGSALQRQGGLDEQNFQARGAINSSAITNDDLRAGRYREARVVESIVDWLYPWAGVFTSQTFWITQTQLDGEQWNAELSTLPWWLRFTSGKEAARNCDRDLGDAGCTVNLGALKVSPCHVTSVTDRSHFHATAFIFVTSDGYFQDGELTWIDGANVGLTFEVKSFLQSGGVFALQLPTPFDIQVGDHFSVVPGCDKTKFTCLNKFANFVNFRGYEDMPGTDRAVSTPQPLI